MKTLEHIPELPGVNPQLIAYQNRNFARLRAEQAPYAVTRDYTFIENDTIDSLQVDATVSNITVTLPLPTGNRRRRIIKTDASANTVTVVGTINGAADHVLEAQYEFVTVEPTGDAWLVVGYGTVTPTFDTVDTTTLNATTVNTNGVKFPATQVPSADANTLDDYEEGTWTPSLGGSATYDTQLGFYTKIGRLVNVHCRLKVHTIGTGSVITVFGLPFTSANTGAAVVAGSVGYWESTATLFTFLTAIVPHANTVVTFAGAGSAVSTLPVSPNVFQNGTDIWFSVTYFV